MKFNDRSMKKKSGDKVILSDTLSTSIERIRSETHIIIATADSQ